MTKGKEAVTIHLPTSLLKRFRIFQFGIFEGKGKHHGEIMALALTDFLDLHENDAPQKIKEMIEEEKKKRKKEEE